MQSCILLNAKIAMQTHCKARFAKHIQRIPLKLNLDEAESRADIAVLHMVKGPKAAAYVRASSKGSKAETTGSSFKRQQESTAPQAKNSGVLIAKCFKVQSSNFKVQS